MDRDPLSEEAGEEWEVADWDRPANACARHAVTGNHMCVDNLALSGNVPNAAPRWLEHDR